MKKILFIIWISLVAVQQAAAQRRVSGLVTDEDGVELLAIPVVVEGSQPERRALTNIEGQFEIEMPPHHHILIFQAEGYERVRLDVREVKDAEALVVVVLVPKKR